MLSLRGGFVRENGFWRGERERERERERWVYGGFKGRVLREGREIGGKGDHGSLVKREREKWGFDGVW